MNLKESAYLDTVLPEHQKISEAPDHEPHMESEEARTLWLLEEKNKLYKAIDGAGNVILMQNPLCWKIEIRDGLQYAIRPKPRIVMKADFSSSKKNKNRGDIF